MRVSRYWCLITAVAILTGCAPSRTVSRVSSSSQVRSSSPATGRRSETGIASYYAAKFHGRRTASGERFSNNAMTAAHRTLPFGTRVRVTNLSNGLSVVVRINDRGPHTKGRIIDVSQAAAKALGMIRTGTARVKVEVLK